MGKAKLTREMRRPNLAITQDPKPEPADRINPTFTRETSLSFHFDPVAERMHYNRPCRESRVIHAAVDAVGTYHLWLMQRFDFADSEPGKKDFFEKATLLPDTLCYEDAMTAMVSAVKGWKNEGFVPSLEPSP